MIKLFVLSGKHICSSLGYKMSRLAKRPVKPLFINFITTYMCNAKCVMCDIWKKYAADTRRKKEISDELTVGDISNFVKRNKDFFSNLRSIGFTGGEAFLRKDIVEILNAAHQELPRVDLGVQTNGLLPEMIKGKIKEILKFYPNFKIAVSLDGLDDTHDQIRGVKGAYEKALTTIRYAKELGISGITCGMTLSVKNFDKIKEVARQVESLGCEFSCFLTEASDYFGNVDNAARLSKEQLSVIAKQLEDFRYHYFMDNLRLQIAGKKKRNLPCYSGYTSYVIDPYGGIFPCILRQDSFGNIRDDDFKDIVNSNASWELRARLKKCTCWCQCEVSSSAVVAPFDVVRWFLKNKNKVEVLKALNKKTLIQRL